MPRKELHPECDGGIFCPVAGHLEHVTRRGGSTFRHVALTAGQKRTMYERRMAERRARQAWLEERHGPISADRETYADGTDWKAASQEWTDHQRALKESKTLSSVAQ